VTLEFSDKDGVLGTVTLDNGVLTGSTRGMQNMADKAVGHQGSAQKAFDYLSSRPSNGYVWVSRRDLDQ
jgi:hypothetical protein